ncbi:unnamed protein product [Gordionus sp. m RMFG-2023]
MTASLPLLMLKKSFGSLQKRESNHSDKDTYPKKTLDSKTIDDKCSINIKKLLEKSKLNSNKEISGERALLKLAIAGYISAYMEALGLFSDLKNIIANESNVVLKFQNSDGSFSNTKNSVSNFYLTIWTIKVICHSHKYTFIDTESNICRTLNW